MVVTISSPYHHHTAATEYKLEQAKTSPSKPTQATSQNKANQARISQSQNKSNETNPESIRNLSQTLFFEPGADCSPPGPIFQAPRPPGPTRGGWEGQG